MARNAHKVPKSQWKKWTSAQGAMFNIVYAMMQRQKLINAHPKSVKLSPAAWKTVKWNTAWLMADFFKE